MSASEGTREEPFRSQFILFGDSLTQQGLRTGGWTARLAAAYSRSADVVNRGFSGYNTRWAVHMLPHVFPSAVPSSPGKPSLAVVFFGANDAVVPDLDEPRGRSRQYVPPEEYASNLNKIIDHLHACELTHVLLVTPGPIDEAAWHHFEVEVKGAPQHIPYSRTLHRSGEYAEVVKQVGQQRSVPVVDLWALVQRRKDWASLLSDGLHFSEAGNGAVYKAIQAAIVEHFPALRPAPILNQPQPTGQGLVFDFEEPWYTESPPRPPALPLPPPAASPAAPPPRSAGLGARCRVLLLGDSLSEQSFDHGDGWGQALANWWERKADVCLRGYSGYNTAWLLELLPHLLTPSQLHPTHVASPAQVVTIFMGANDSALAGAEDKPNFQAVPVEEYKANLKEIVAAVRASVGAEGAVLLLTPPPADEDAWQAFSVKNFGWPSHWAPSRSQRSAGVYAAACKEVGAATSTPVVDLFGLMGARGDWRELLRDGLHLSTAGNAVVAAAVQEAVEQHYPGFAPAALAPDWPDWTEIDADDPAAILLQPPPQQQAREERGGGCDVA